MNNARLQMLSNNQIPPSRLLLFRHRADERQNQYVSAGYGHIEIKGCLRTFMTMCEFGIKASPPFKDDTRSKI